MREPSLAFDHEQQGFEHLSRLARSLTEGLASAAAAHAEHVDSDLAPKVRIYLRARRRRESLFGGDIFADPVWDVLLDLYASMLEGRRVCVSDACIASSVPSTTALRWLGKMEELELIVRHQDDADGRRFYVELTERARAAMGLWLQGFLAELQDHEA